MVYVVQVTSVVVVVEEVMIRVSRWLFLGETLWVAAVVSDGVGGVGEREICDRVCASAGFVGVAVAAQEIEPRIYKPDIVAN